jgi:hypothetical protein
MLSWEGDISTGKPKKRLAVKAMKPREAKKDRSGIRESPSELQDKEGQELGIPNKRLSVRPVNRMESKSN